MSSGGKFENAGDLALTCSVMALRSRVRIFYSSPVYLTGTPTNTVSFKQINSYGFRDPQEQDPGMRLTAKCSLHPDRQIWEPLQSSQCRSRLVAA
jgi:hypothetical protein